jgi:hypothetical protein
VGQLLEMPPVGQVELQSQQRRQGFAWFGDGVEVRLEDPLDTETFASASSKYMPMSR